MSSLEQSRACRQSLLVGDVLVRHPDLVGLARPSVQCLTWQSVGFGRQPAIISTPHQDSPAELFAVDAPEVKNLLAVACLQQGRPASSHEALATAPSHSLRIWPVQFAADMVYVHLWLQPIHLQQYSQEQDWHNSTTCCRIIPINPIFAFVSAQAPLCVYSTKRLTRLRCWTSMLKLRTTSLLMLAPLLSATAPHWTSHSVARSSPRALFASSPRQIKSS